jgi:hypothetical protein
VCDWESLAVLKEIKSPYLGKDNITAIKFVGKKSVVMYSISQKGKIMIWNVSSLIPKATTH